jgi:peptide-methionine (R)-S-oxide reductase
VDNENKKDSTEKSIAMGNSINKPGNPYYSNTDTKKIKVSDAEWKKILPEDVYEVSRNADTERPLQENIGTPMKRNVLLRRLWK